MSFKRQQQLPQKQRSKLQGIEKVVATITIIIIILFVIVIFIIIGMLLSLFLLLRLLLRLYYVIVNLFKYPSIQANIFVIYILNFLSKSFFFF